MKFIKFFVVAVLAAMTADASAQLTKDTKGWTRVELSFDAMKMKYKDGNSTWGTDNDKYKGAAIAFMKGVNITSKMPLFLDLGARLTWLHAKEDYSNYSSVKTTFMNVAVPVNVAYKLSFASSPISIVPFFGPNFKFNFYGRTKWEDSKGNETKIKWLSDGADGRDAKVFQFGLNLGVGVNIKSFYVGYTFQPDLSSYVKNEYDNKTVKTKTINNLVSVGINF